MTNFEYIKKQYVTPEAMAKFLAENTSCETCIYGARDHCGGMCKIGIKQWLESEVEQNDGT